MLHRIRLLMQDENFGSKLGGDGGEVEADETFIGGKARNMHKDVHARRITGMGQSFRTRPSSWDSWSAADRFVLRSLQIARRKPCSPSFVSTSILGSALFTDEMGGYKGLVGEYAAPNHRPRD